MLRSLGNDSFVYLHYDLFKNSSSVQKLLVRLDLNYHRDN